MVRPRLALLLLSLLLFLPGNFALPPIDRDETHYAQITAQMIETGNFVEPKFQEAQGALKPVGMFWVRAAFVALFSSADARDIWVYRLPSLFGAMLAVLLTFWGGRILFDANVALLGASLVAASLMLLGEATLSKTDAALLACIAAAQFSFGRIYLAARSGDSLSWFALPRVPALVLWFAVTLGVLFKGPIAPGVVGLTVIGLVIADRDIIWLKGLSLFWGLAVAVVILIPWSTAVVQTEFGADYLTSLFDEISRMIFKGDRLHSAPPGYYAVLSMIIFWPGSLFLIPAAIWSWQNRVRPEVRFCLAWIIPSWLLFEIAINKLPYYLIPLYPAMALLCAKWIFEVAAERDAETWLSKVVWFGLGFWLVSSLVVALLPAGLDVMFSDGLTLASIVVAVVTLGLSFAGLRLLIQNRPLMSAGVVVAAVALFNLYIQQIQLPGLTALHISPAMVEALERHTPNEKGSVHIVGYSEPSLVFLLGTDTKMTTFRRAAAYVSQSPGRAAFVEEQHLEKFLSEIARRGTVIEQLETVNGFNYTRGTNISLTLFRSAN